MALRESDPEETLYSGLMEGLGYSANRKPFLELARAVPVATLRALGAEPSATRSLAMTAILLNAASLLDYAESLRSAPGFEGLLSHLPQTGSVARRSWRLCRVRPANHPARRIVGAANVLGRYLESGLVRGLVGELRRGAGRLVDGLVARPHIGVGRGRELAVSVVLPYTHAWAGMRGDEELRALCLREYRSFPTSEGNGITREMSRLLSQRGEVVRVTEARRHQGLMQLYRSMSGRVVG